MNITQNEATRIVAVIDKRIRKYIGRGVISEVTYGDVDTVSGFEASVLLGADDTPSQGFRIPAHLNVAAGDRVRVAIDPRGQRYIEEVINTSTKTSLDVVRGFLSLVEVGEPSSPAANKAVLFVKDNGSGKTQLCVKFTDGTVTVLATQP